MTVAAQPARPVQRGLATVVLCGVVYFAGAALLPNGVPVGILVVGVALGMINAMGAIGLILVYRAGRYVNFAQGALGAVGATLAFRLVSIKGWNWYLAVLLGLATAIALAGICELLFIQRLFKSSRLVVTIATIGIAQFASFFGLLTTNLINDRAMVAKSVIQPPPFHIDFTIGPVRFDSSYVLVFCVAPIVLVGLALFFRRSKYGVVIEAAAQNVDRARLVGISVRGLSTIVWMMVGFLGGLAAILSAPITSLNLGASAGPTLLLYSLAPAMIGGLASIPVAAAAALGLGIVQQSLAFNYASSGPTQLVLFLVIVVTLFLRRRQLGAGGRLGDPPLTLGTSTRPFPRELRKDRLLQLVRGGARGLCLVIAAVIPAILSLSQTNRATVILVYILAALSLTVLTGFAGQVSFGQWALVGAGGLFAGYLAAEYDLQFIVGLFLIPALGLLLAAVIGLPALQLRGILLGVTTLAFAVAASAYIFGLEYFHFTGQVGAPFIGNIDLSKPKNYYYVALVVVLIALAVVGRLRKSAIGRNMLAVRDNSTVAAAYGISVLRTRVIAFAVSGCFATMAGYLYLYNQRHLSAGTFGPDVSLALFAGVIIGGASSRMGAVIAGLFLQGIVVFLPGELQIFATSLGLLLVLMLIPDGVSGVLFDVRDRLLIWYARRRGVRLSWAQKDTESIGAASVPAARRDTADASELAVASGASGQPIGTTGPLSQSER